MSSLLATIILMIGILLGVVCGTFLDAGDVVAGRDNISILRNSLATEVSCGCQGLDYKLDLQTGSGCCSNGPRCVSEHLDLGKCVNNAQKLKFSHCAEFYY